MDVLGAQGADDQIKDMLEGVAQALEKVCDLLMLYLSVLAILYINMRVSVYTQETVQ
jgi:hypothetical protein